jgi:hypothetical protein
MERDMGTTIATKADLAGIRQEQALLRKDLEAQSAGFRKDTEALATSMQKDMQLLSTSMTVRLGSMLVVGFGVMIAILRLLPD